MENQNKIIKDIKQDYHNKMLTIKSDYKNKLVDSQILKFEKEILKDEVALQLNKLKRECKIEVKKAKDPDKFEINQKRLEAEKTISSFDNETILKVSTLKRQLKKAKRKKNIENISPLKQEIYSVKKSRNQELKQMISDKSKNNEISKPRVYSSIIKNQLTQVHAKTMPILGRIANQKHLMAIRNAFSSLIPFIMISSFITVIRSIPTSFNPDDAHAYLYTYFPQVLDTALVTISSLTMGIMALGLAIAIGINLGQSYGEAPLMSAIMGMLGFILWVGPETLAESAGKTGQGLPLADLGSQGLFVALLSSMVMVELYRIFKKYRITIRLPKSVPPAVGNSFIAIIPALVYASFVLVIRYVVGFDLIVGLTGILAPFGKLLSDNFGAVIFILMLNSLFWWFGIHGSAITGIITYPFWYPMIAENQEWWNNGAIGEVPNKFVEGYYQWTIWIGGSGTTIGLAIASLLVSKSKQNKAMAKATIVPAVFNISEPLMFGFPVVLNIYLFLPFIFAPVLVAISSLALVSLFGISWVAVSPWTMPGPLGAFLASGNNFWAVIVSFVSIALGTLIYLPFYKAFDKQTLREEREFTEKEAEKEGLSVYDYMKKQALSELAIKQQKKDAKAERANKR